jgi:hypothetical protein
MATSTIILLCDRAISARIMPQQTHPLRTLRMDGARTTGKSSHQIWEVTLKVFLRRSG